MVAGFKLANLSHKHNYYARNLKRHHQLRTGIDTPVTYDKTKAFTHAVAQSLEKKLPKLVLSNTQKSLGAGKVFVDWSQNDPHKTTVSVYSLRAKDHPTVSITVSWDELETA